MHDGNSLSEVQASMLLYHINTIIYLQRLPIGEQVRFKLSCLFYFLGQGQHSRGSHNNILQDEFHVGLSLQQNIKFSNRNCLCRR